MRRSNAPILLTLLVALAVERWFAPAQTANVPPQTILRDLHQVQLADGIDDRGYVSIGGLKQWISVQGRHKDAPVLLFLHGGPALSSIPMSWLFLTPWEEYFTVAQWDQRGTGKTYEADHSAGAAKTMTIARMLTDAEEVTTYLRTRYGRRKIIVVGYSWGSIPGVMLVQRHPDWFYAYVGMGQLVDFVENEHRGYQKTLAEAAGAGDREAVASLQSMAPFPDAGKPERNLANLSVERKWLEKYQGAIWHGSISKYDRVARLSPDYTAADLKARDEGQTFSFKVLWPALWRVSFVHQNHFGLPVIFLHGSHDVNDSASLLDEWFETIQAPYKKLVWFEDSGHYPEEEEPGKMLVVLVQNVLPLARDVPH